jgi:hypothetical protein
MGYSALSSGYRFLDQGLQLPALVHLGYDVAAAD